MNYSEGGYMPGPPTQMLAYNHGDHWSMTPLRFGKCPAGWSDQLTACDRILTGVEMTWPHHVRAAEGAPTELKHPSTAEQKDAAVEKLIHAIEGRVMKKQHRRVTIELGWWEDDKGFETGIIEVRRVALLSGAAVATREDSTGEYEVTR